jgi:hypothetical protein
MDTSPVAPHPVSTRVLSAEPLTSSWDELDPWWDIYTEGGRGTAEQIADLLARSNTEWAQSPAPFDTDPLAAELTLDRRSRGPLQPTNEVEYSRWLARLLRPSAAFLTELFGVEVEQPPEEVRREDRLAKEDQDSVAFRRPDILVFHRNQGISIEVKLGDENYAKTADAARLVEHHHDEREWTHTILLPKRKHEQLTSVVDPPVKRRPDDQLQIEWDVPGPIAVHYWSDVTAAIRSTLRRGDIVDAHWAANAYLFCAVVEQQLMGFHPQPVLDQLTGASTVVDTLHPIMLTETLEEQLSYLQSRVKA